MPKIEKNLKTWSKFYFSIFHKVFKISIKYRKVYYKVSSYYCKVDEYFHKVVIAWLGMRNMAGLPIPLN